MLNNLRNYFFNKSLKQCLAEQKRQRKIFNLDSARTIGLLFDGKNEKLQKEALELFQELEKKGKMVQSIGLTLLDAEKAESQKHINLGPKDLKWDQTPKAEKVEKFVQEKFDLLLCLNLHNNQTLGWLSAQSNASMKIGTATTLPNDLDLQIDTPADKGIRYFMDQLNHYIHTIQ